MLLYQALHIIFMVCWFAGLFYVGRLFVYYQEAQSKPDREKKALSHQLVLMMRRLFYIIAWPSAVLTTLLGLHLLHATKTLQFGWMHAKLGLIILLWAYHIACHLSVARPERLKALTSKRLRIYNEIPSVLLIAIVFLATMKTTHVIVPVILTIAFFGVLAVLLSKLLKTKIEAL